MFQYRATIPSGVPYAVPPRDSAHQPGFWSAQACSASTFYQHPRPYTCNPFLDEIEAQGPTAGPIAQPSVQPRHLAGHPNINPAAQNCRPWNSAQQDVRGALASLDTVPYGDARRPTTNPFLSEPEVRAPMAWAMAHSRAEPLRLPTLQPVIPCFPSYVSGSSYSARKECRSPTGRPMAEPKAKIGRLPERQSTNMSANMGCSLPKAQPKIQGPSKPIGEPTAEPTRVEQIQPTNQAAAAPEAPKKATPRHFASVGTQKHIEYNMNDKAQEQALVNVNLQMRLNVDIDVDFETRLWCESHFFLTLPDRSLDKEPVATVDFSIFNGRPSHCFPGGKEALFTWAKDWCNSPLSDERYEDYSAEECAHAIRSLFCKNGVVKRGRKIEMGPGETDTLVFISKITINPVFSGKGLLKHIVEMVLAGITHSDIPNGYRVFGPVCCVLEPGFIDTDENKEFWRLKDKEESQEEMIDRVIHVLINAVYPKVGFNVFRMAWKEQESRDAYHSYMGRRVYAYPPVEGENVGQIRELSSEYGHKQFTLPQGKVDQSGAATSAVAVPAAPMTSSAQELKQPKPKLKPANRYPRKGRVLKPNPRKDSGSASRVSYSSTTATGPTQQPTPTNSRRASDEQDRRKRKAEDDDEDYSPAKRMKKDDWRESRLGYVWGPPGEDKENVHDSEIK